MAAADVTGLVLAGGMGRRMGGADKGLLLRNGRPLAAIVLQGLAPQVGPLLISANRHPEQYAALGAPVLADRMPDYAGPLAGIQAGLHACTTSFLMAVPCDVPDFPPDLVARLLAALEEPGAPTVAVAATTQRVHATTLLLRREVLPSLERYLNEGGRKVQGWLTQENARQVLFPDEAAFANLNRPEDLRPGPSP
ncbi:molybdenum cofactor guanylyltransferase MobA [Denitratisoma oestradiolicum]|uniref:Molybdenum cofactor guanylyltransferase n=1 Tax=Denitratisoma oestradiolicum TaxID=311182 RepID=A0A6S6XZB5_9PROT|nr:molybdenum cofactor guanylyltransferase MobA [Denitratisoma oestradiolicum]TWO79238.1 molybdenum cofactor guanylyltransferase [Denitratisoma oestradiolicum]CAB1368242.1 Molybdenum cofactor guanylyltransferase [Denitratisoma oestradiolicum]